MRRVRLRVRAAAPSMNFSTKHTLDTWIDALSARGATPLAFSDLWRHEANPSQAVETCDELGVRFSHQLARLKHAQAQQQRSFKPIDVLLALHRDSLRLLHDHQPLLRRMADTATSAQNQDKRSRWRIDPATVLQKCMKELEDRHASATETVIEALRSSALPANTCHDFLLMRTGTQILIQHHLDVWAHPDQPQLPQQPQPHEPQRHAQDRQVIVRNASWLADLANDCANEAKVLCEAQFRDAPSVEVVCVDSQANFEVTSVPSLVRYIVLELLKNAMRATVLRAQQSQTPHATMGKVELVVEEASPSQGGLLVKIADQGVGMAAEAQESARQSLMARDEHEATWDRVDTQVSYQPARHPFFGIGVGLPMSMVYAE